MRLRAGQVALITGGGTGIGRGVVLALARRGVDVALVGRRAAALQATAAEAMTCGVRALVLPADITDAAARQTVMACSSDALGPIDLLVNNAGVLAGGSLADQTAASIETAVATNLAAAIDLTRLALPQLAATRGAVILVGSTMSHVPMPYATLYAATKAGLRAFGEALRYELTPLGVQVLTACPPATRTAMLAGTGRLAAKFQADPLATGERIVRALEQGHEEAVWGIGAQLLVRLHRLAPGCVQHILRRQGGHFARTWNTVAASQP